MSLKRFIALIAVVVLAIAGACAGYRVWRILAYPIGTGQKADSPDGRFSASVMSFYDEDFWGHSRSWFEFKLARKSDRNVIQSLVTDPIAGPYFGSRSTNSVISWSENSKTVNFVFPKVVLTMNAETQ